MRHPNMKSVSIISPIAVFPRQGFGAVDIIFRFNLQEVLRGVHAFFLPEMYLRMQIYSWKKTHPVYDSAMIHILYLMLSVPKFTWPTPTPK